MPESAIANLAVASQARSKSQCLGDNTGGTVLALTSSSKPFLYFDRVTVGIAPEWPRGTQMSYSKS